MGFTIWPKKNWLSIIRLLFLLGLLLVVIVCTIELNRIGRQIGESFLRFGLAVTGGRFFEGLVRKPPSNQFDELESDAVYGLSLVRQITIAEKCGQFFKDKRSVPKSPAELTNYGLLAADQADPWNRPYRIHELSNHVVVVQSTGRSGIDKVPWSQPKPFNMEPGRRYYVVGDNLLVVRQLPAKIR